MNAAVFASATTDAEIRRRADDLLAHVASRPASDFDEWTIPGRFDLIVFAVYRCFPEYHDLAVGCSNRDDAADGVLLQFNRPQPPSGYTCAIVLTLAEPSVPAFRALARSRAGRVVFIHEFGHYWRLRQSGGKVNLVNYRKGATSADEYYNNASEADSYYLEAVHAYELAGRSAGAVDFRTFLDDLARFVYPKFAQHRNVRSSRRFVRRAYAYWSSHQRTAVGRVSTYLRNKPHTNGNLELNYDR